MIHAMFSICGIWTVVATDVSLDDEAVSPVNLLQMQVAVDADGQMRVNKSFEFDAMLDSDAGDVAEISATAYVPGQPGAQWTAAEMQIVREKLHGAMDAPKFLRLGFHDCFKYKDGSGGCDGCTDHRGMGHRFPRDMLERGILNMKDASDNNGLESTMSTLERIYTETGYPSGAATLSPSLQDRGKSRADLWAFAALVAVEYSIALNNWVCDNPSLGKELIKQCHPREGLPDCKVELPRPFRFTTGRKDCVSTGGTWEHKSAKNSYKTDKEEVAPQATADGEKTVEWFKENFGFTGRETVAILGAHTLGRVHVQNSLFRYTWKTASGSLFNNGYFRNLALKPDWHYPSGGPACAYVGGAHGERPPARWVAKVFGDTANGGPMQWIQEKLVCPGFENTKCSEDELRWKFVMGIDEIALNADMGMYYNFTTDADGLPRGDSCPGFEHFNMANWGNNFPEGGLKNYDMTWSTINGVKSDPQCSKNMMRDPPGSTPLHQIVEEYADDSAKFLADFVPTLEKMLANGYASTELQAAPAEGMTGWADIPVVPCRSCFIPSGESTCFSINNPMFECEGCVVGDGWHCPNGCVGQLCRNATAPPAPAPPAPAPPVPCGRCFIPSGESTCFSMIDPMVQCDEDCVVGDGWHCPNGCVGQLCKNATVVPAPAAR